MIKQLSNQITIRSLVLVLMLLVLNGELQPTFASESKRKCHLKISGVWTKFDSKSATYIAEGRARAEVEGQAASISADCIEYDSVRKMIDAKGHVSILRNGTVTTGARFKFHASSNKNIVTDSQCVVGGVQLAEGMFSNEPMTVDHPWEDFSSGKVDFYAGYDARGSRRSN